MEWTADLAYVIGLLTTDGNLSKDGRHINLTSKDMEQLENFKAILALTNKVGIKKSSYNPQGIYYQVQFGDVVFYKFLLEIGLMPCKSKILGSLLIPNKYYVDFLRGHLDGDGYTHSYWDKRWKHSFMLYTGFVSASKPHLEWMKEKILKLYKIEGRIKFAGRSVFQLVYAKNALVYLLRRLYYSPTIPSLSRKRFKIERSLAIIANMRMC